MNVLPAALRLWNAVRKERASEGGTFGQHPTGEGADVPPFGEWATIAGLAEDVYDLYTKRLKMTEMR